MLLAVSISFCVGDEVVQDVSNGSGALVHKHNPIAVYINKYIYIYINI